MYIELRVFRYFLAVVKEQTVSAAAESLNLTQPALSRLLRDLGEELSLSVVLTDGLNRLKKAVEQ